MESKIALYDADGKSIGETFVRRARQLVKQQRATWLDEEHTAIRFNADPALDEAETWEAANIPYPAPTPAATGEKRPTRSPLYAIAEAKLRERRRVIFHVLLSIPTFIGIVIFTILINGGWHAEPAFLFFGFASGVLLTFNICNIRNYFKMYGLGSFLDNRKETQLAIEVERLRRLGYGE